MLCFCLGQPFFNGCGVRGELCFVLFNWSSRLTSAILWENCVSHSFSVAQGVRQGAVLSRLLYAVFTSNLLYLLESSGLGVVIDQMELFVGSPTFADDIALVDSSLQAMLQIDFEWRYSINPTKSQILPITHNYQFL